MRDPVNNLEHCIFQTALGWIGLVWRDSAIVRLLMPQNDRSALGRKAASLHSVELSAADAPEFVLRAIDLVQAYAAGSRTDFSQIPVEAGDVGPMRQAIYRALRDIGFGETLTYGELATRAGYPGMAREIGEAMGKNPVPIIVPCHRVIAAGGKLGGFSAPGGATTKERLLALEGVRLGPPPAPQLSLGL